MSHPILSIFGYKPTDAQELLLQAALLEGQPALTAWEQWQSLVDIENLDASSYSLLPSLYQNLLRHPVEDAHMARLKGVYRRTWYANQLRLSQIRSVLMALAAVEVTPILLGDAALSPDHTDCNRPIHSFALLLRLTDMEATVQTLNSLKWHPVDGDSAGGQGALPLRFQDDRQQLLSVQGHLFWAIPQSDTDELVWQYAIPNLHMAGLLLSPADQLLYLCSTTFCRDRGDPLRGIADALILMRQSGDTLDWNRFVSQAQRYQMIIPVRNMLMLLKHSLQCPAPKWVIPALSQMPIAQTEWLQYQIWAGNRRLLAQSACFRLIRPLVQLDCQMMRLKRTGIRGKNTVKRFLMSKLVT